MELLSYNNELINAQSQFMRIFSNIKLKRLDKSGATPIVTCLNGRRSRLIKDIQNPGRTQQILPAIYISRVGLERAPSRNANQHNEVLYSRNNLLDYNMISPTPVDITYELFIVTKYMEDLDVILSNFIPFFNQDVYVKSVHPKFKDEVLNSQIVWDGIVTEEVIDELENIQPDIQTAMLTFKFKTYIFAGTSNDVNIPSSNVIDFTIIADGDAHNLVGGFIPVQSSDTFNGYFEELTTTRPISSVTYDHYMISANSMVHT